MSSESTPTITTWVQAGSPPDLKSHEITGECWLCGGELETGQTVKKAIPKTFLQSMEAACPESDVVCEACIMMMSKRKFAFPGRQKPDGKFGPCPTNLTHGFDQSGGYWNATKGEKPAIRAFIASQKVAPWFLAIADSGQKHVLPFARMQLHDGVGGEIRFETQSLCIPDGAASQIEKVTEILTAGVTKAELLSGAYSARTYKNIGRSAVLEFERFATSVRGSAWFALLVWVCQRGEK